MPPSLIDAIVTPSTPGAPWLFASLGRCPPHDIAAGDLVAEGVEASGGFLLGTAIEHTLKGSDRVHAFGVADGSSRVFGTHQGSSTTSQCTGEAGALRSDRVVLSRPSALTTAPSDFLSAPWHFP